MKLNKCSFKSNKGLNLFKSFLILISKTIHNIYNKASIFVSFKKKLHKVNHKLKKLIYIIKVTF